MKWIKAKQLCTKLTLVYLYINLRWFNGDLRSAFSSLKFNCASQDNNVFSKWLSTFKHMRFLRMHNDNMRCIYFVVLVHFNIILNVTYIYWTYMCKSVQQANTLHTLTYEYTSPVTWLRSPPSTWKLFIWKSDENYSVTAILPMPWHYVNITWINVAFT
jgi:hypothetical protein